MSSLAVLLFAVVVILCTGSGSAATIEIRPNKYDGVIPTSFNITCTPHVSAANACPKKILAIQVSRNGSRPFVTLQPQSEISYNRLLRSNIEAEGRIGKTVGESRLTVTFSNVMKEDSGLYSCDVIYLDEWGSIQRETATHNFTVEGPDTHDVIKYLMGKLVSMETIIQNQQTQLETTLQNQQTQLEMKFQNQQTQMETTFQNQQTQLETTLQNQQTQLETTIQNQQTQMEKQENRMSELDDKTTRYIEKESRKSAFLVGYENKGALSYGQIVKFTNVRENIGGDFNVTSGVYTAPVDGLYAFHLYGMVYKSGHKELQIGILANSQKVAALLAEDGDNYDQSSVSAVVNLKAGGIVKCSVTYLRSTANQLHSFPYSGFTGHLITAL